MTKVSLDDEFKKIQTVEELRKFVTYNESRGRTVFTLKIFYVLQFVKQHPDKLEEIGASWCKDNVHFVSNSKILGDFLKLKSNSINTNFREHGFKIIPYTTAQLKKEFPNLSDTRHWKTRYSDNPFNSNSSGLEVEKIKKISDNLVPDVPQNSSNSNFLPTETIQLLQTDQSQIYDLIQLYYSVTEDETFFSNFLSYVTELWKQKISQNEFAELITVISVILNINFNDENANIDTMDFIHKTNLEYLLPQNFENSQTSDYIKFSSFVKYFLRFSDKFDISSTLKEISQPTVFSYDLHPSFCNWFRPSPDKSNAINSLTKQLNNSWLVMPSKTSNKFTLLLVESRFPLKVLALHIKHNPIPESPDKKYSVPFSDGPKFGGSLFEVFNNILGLSVSEIQQDANFQVSVTTHVTGDEIVNRMKNNQNLNFDLNNEQSQNQYQNDLPSDSQSFRFDFSQSSQPSFSQLDFPSQLNDNNL